MPDVQMGCKLALKMAGVFPTIFCTFAIPTLLVWGYSRWNKGSRREQPHYHNGMGLASIPLTLASWPIRVFG